MKKLKPILRSELCNPSSLTNLAGRTIILEAIILSIIILILSVDSNSCNGKSLNSIELIYSFTISTSFGISYWAINTIMFSRGGSNNSSIPNTTLLFMYIFILAVVNSSLTFLLLWILSNIIELFYPQGNLKLLKNYGFNVIVIQLFKLNLIIQFSILIITSYFKRVRLIKNMNSNNTPYIQLKKSETLIFKGLNKNDNHEIFADELLYIKSDGHYLKIFILDKTTNKLTYKFIRNSIKNLEGTRIGQINLIRIHRSTLVNTKQIKKVRLHPNSGIIYLKKNNIKIPVSKTYFENIPKELVINNKYYTN